MKVFTVNHNHTCMAMLRKQNLTEYKGEYATVKFLYDVSWNIQRHFNVEPVVEKTMHRDVIIADYYPNFVIEIICLWLMGFNPYVTYVVASGNPTLRIYQRYAGQPMSRRYYITWNDTMQAMQDLHRLHTTGFSHGDIHRNNIVKSRQGVFLVDFGLARPIAEQPSMMDRQHSLHSRHPTLQRMYTWQYWLDKTPHKELTKCVLEKVLRYAKENIERITKQCYEETFIILMGSISLETADVFALLKTCDDSRGIGSLPRLEDEFDNVDLMKSMYQMLRTCHALVRYTHKTPDVHADIYHTLTRLHRRVKTCTTMGTAEVFRLCRVKPRDTKPCMDMTNEMKKITGEHSIHSIHEFSELLLFNRYHNHLHNPNPNLNKKRKR